MTAIIATFGSKADASQAINALEERGIRRDDISLIMSQKTRESMFADLEEDPKLSNSMRGAGTGAAIGGSLAAIIAGLTAVGTVAVPGLGILATGPAVAFLAAGGAGAALGGVAGALVGAGVSDEEAKLYENEVKRGKVIVSVHTEDPDEIAAAKDVLKVYRTHAA